MYFIYKMYLTTDHVAAIKKNNSIDLGQWNQNFKNANSFLVFKTHKQCCDHIYLWRYLIQQLHECQQVHLGAVNISDTAHHEQIKEFSLKMEQQSATCL